MVLHRRVLFCIVAAISIAAITGCGMAGSRGSMSLDNLAYPVSMSPFLYGPRGESVEKGKDLAVVGKFEYVKYHWGILYSAVALSGTGDIGEAINAEIARLHGDGMVNLTVTAKNGFLNSIPIFNLLPIWPGFTRLEVEGDIVKLSGVNRHAGQ